MIVTAATGKLQIELDCGCQIEEQPNFEPDFISVCDEHGQFESKTLVDVLTAAVEKFSAPAKAPAKA